MQEGREGAAAKWSRYVAIGDSFTEGVGDELADGQCRGWADLLAAELAAHSPDPARFGYANLAVRGKLLGPIIDDQLDAALALGPDLVSIVAGGNDLLRPAARIPTLIRQLDLAVARLADSGADVLMFTGADPLDHVPMGRLVRGQALRFCDGVRAVAARRGATLVDLFPDTELADVQYWSDDQLHLNAAGHRQVAARALDALGVARPSAWSAPAESARSAESFRPAPADRARYYRDYVAPWVGRRLTGRSSGDGRTAKRPTLQPVSSTPIVADVGPSDQAVGE